MKFNKNIQVFTDGKRVEVEQRGATLMIEVWKARFGLDYVYFDAIFLTNAARDELIRQEIALAYEQVRSDVDSRIWQSKVPRWREMVGISHDAGAIRAAIAKLDTNFAIVEPIIQRVLRRPIGAAADAKA